jgi:hypothetical protein
MIQGGPRVAVTDPVVVSEATPLARHVPAAGQISVRSWTALLHSARGPSDRRTPAEQLT